MRFVLLLNPNLVETSWFGYQFDIWYGLKASSTARVTAWSTYKTIFIAACAEANAAVDFVDGYRIRNI